MNQKLLLLIALLAVSTASDAQTIYKCKADKGGTSYQTEPCAPGVATKSAKTYAPIHDDPNAAARLRRIEADMADRSSVSSSVVNNVYGVSPSTDQRTMQRQKCDAAKANRAATLERVGLRRTYNLLQQLDATVNRACART